MVNFVFKFKLMQIKRIFLLLVIALSLNSCLDSIDGNGKVKTETRDVSSFDKIEVSDNFQVILNQGVKEKLEIAVDENLIKFIETKVENNILKISSARSIKYKR